MQSKKLKPEDLKRFQKPGRYSDGNGLNFYIGSKGERKFTFRYKSRTERYPSGEPKVHELGLGGAPAVDKPITFIAASLADARRSADAMAALLKAKKDPLTERRANAVQAVEAVAIERAKEAALVSLESDSTVEKDMVFFGTLADSFIKRKVKGFKDPEGKNAKQWQSTIDTYAAALRPMRLDAIDTAAIRKVLDPIWYTIPETASRLRGRIEAVLDLAKVLESRTGENPARWKGHLDKVYDGRKDKDKTNHAALSYTELPGFMVELRKLTSISARALEWTILNSSRTGETIGARWSEIDFETKVWTVPASRMKMGKESRIPLTDRALSILAALRAISKTAPDKFIFQSGVTGERGLSNMAMAECLKGVRKGVTVHGFRSSFSDWANDTTQHDRQVIEFALSHVIGDKAEAAYRRGDALEKRRALLTDWESYLE